MSSNKKQQRGFTLVEIIVSVGIFSLVTIVVSSVVVAVLNTNIKTREYSLTLDNANIVIEGLIRDIREGSDYHCGYESSFADYANPKDCVDGGEYFAYESTGGNSASSTDQIVLRKAQQGGRYTIQKSTDGGQNFATLYSLDDVSFENFRFYVSGSEDPDMVPRVTVVVSGTISSGVNSLLDFSYQTTVSERFSPEISKTSEVNFTEPTDPEGGEDLWDPQAWFVFPQNNKQVEGGADVLLRADASDQGSGVKRVTFYDDRGVIGSDSGDPPYSVEWNTFGLPEGTNYLYVVARDNAGNESDKDSSKIRVILDNPTDTSEPTVSIIRPINNQKYKDTDVWNMEVSVTEDNAIASSRFLLNGQDIAFSSSVSGDNYTFTRNITAGSIPNLGRNCSRKHDTCEHRLEVEISDGVNLPPSEDDVTFYIEDTQAPDFTSLEVYEPTGTIEKDDEVKIRVTVTDPMGGSGIDNVQMYRKRIDPPCPFWATWICDTREINLTRSGSVYTGKWDTPDYGSDDITYRIWVEAEDKVGHDNTSGDLIIVTED